jgi:hypothetical protein
MTNGELKFAATWRRRQVVTGSQQIEP